MYKLVIAAVCALIADLYVSLQFRPELHVMPGAASLGIRWGVATVTFWLVLWALK